MNIQIFDIYILLLVTSKKIVLSDKNEGRNHVSTAIIAIINLLYSAI